MRAASAALSAWLDTTTAAGPFPHLVTITPQTGSVAYWTDHVSDLTYGGHTFTAAGTGTVPLIEMGRREEVAGTEIGALEIVLKCGEAAQFNGMRLPLSAANGAFDGATVLVQRVYRTDVTIDDYVMHLFKGRVAEAEPSSAQVVLQIESGLVALNIPVPKLPLQQGCANILYDTQCGLVKATYTVTATVTSGATTLSVPTNRTEADDYFTLGVLTFTSGANDGISRAVRSYDNTGGTFVPDRALPAAPAVDDTFTVHPGCRRNLDDCINKFAADNTARYRGFPFIPSQDWVEVHRAPFDVASTAERREVFGRPRYVQRERPALEAVLPVVYGQTRIDGRLVYADVTLNGTASPYVERVLALSEGPITGCARVWEAQESRETPDGYSLAIATGTRPTQTALTTLRSAYAFGYPGVAYAFQSLILPSWEPTDVPETYSFEVKGLEWNTGGAGGDAHAADVIVDVLTSSDYGAGQDSADVVTDTGQDGTAASSFRRYATAEKLCISPALTEQRPALDWLREILDSTNSELLWSEGKFKIIPLGDASVTGGGVTYTPYNTIQYALTTDNLMAEGDDDAIGVERPPADDIFNSCPVEFLDRDPAAAAIDPSHRYSPATVDDPEPVDVEVRGPRKAPVLALHGICVRDVALKISRIRAQRSVLARNTYTFTVGWPFCRLEPLDFVSLTEPLFGLDAAPVRIRRIEEDPESGALTITAEDWPFGVGSVVAHTTQSSDGPSGNWVRLPLETRLHELATATWGQVTGLDNGLAAVASDGAGTIVAVGTNVCTISTDDGRTWASQTIGTGVWRAVVWADWLSLFVAVGDGTICKTSPTGVTWTTQTITSGDFKAITVTDTTLVAVGASCAATSTNATSWTDRTAAIPAGTYVAAACNTTDGVVVAIGTDLCASSTTNGTSWTARTMATGAWAGAAFGLVGGETGLFLAAGGSGAIATGSRDGQTWALQTAAPGSSSLTAVAHDGFLFAIMSGSNEKLWTTTDGETLTLRYSAESSPLAICWTGTRFCGVDDNGTGQLSTPV
jgi:uncharacterized phage protein (TIGR02218 family)